MTDATDDGRLLLAAVLEHPADDAPRAMFADWLQDRECPRDRWLGEFVACQLAGRPWGGLINLDALVGEVASDLRGYGVRLHHCPNVISYPVTYWGTDMFDNSKPVFDVNRGFVCGADLECGDFVRCAGALFARHPIDRVELTNRRPLIVEDRYSWSCSDYSDYEHDPWKLPSALFAHVAGYDPRLNDELGDGLGDDMLRIFHHLPYAVASLRRAALAFGRARASARAARNAP